MKKISIIIVFFIYHFLSCLAVNAQNKFDVDRQLTTALQQYKGMLNVFKDSTLFPQSLDTNGNYTKRESSWWCSGFFAGNLWYLYEYSKDTFFKDAANKWSLALKNVQFDSSTHDLGFMLYCSLGNGYRLTENNAYKQILYNGAHSLASRYNNEVGLIKSWDWMKDYKFPVIIDNMMNLEYLLWAAKVFKDSSLYKIAINHADNTLKNHFRSDYSSYHLVCYDPKGDVIKKMTFQGYDDNSAWARGQAWGLYSYVFMYRETKDKKYLKQAENIANFYITHPNLPKDNIPYWDFNSPQIPNDFRDASAAAIVASALLELSNYSNSLLAKKYFLFAEKCLKSLSSPTYFAEAGNKYFLLKHSTGHKKADSEVDVPLIYADYYYLEALLRYKKIKKEK